MTNNQKKLLLAAITSEPRELKDVLDDVNRDKPLIYWDDAIKSINQLIKKGIVKKITKRLPVNNLKSRVTNPYSIRVSLNKMTEKQQLLLDAITPEMQNLQDIVQTINKPKVVLCWKDAVDVSHQLADKGLIKRVTKRSNTKSLGNTVSSPKYTIKVRLV